MLVPPPFLAPFDPSRGNPEEDLRAVRRSLDDGHRAAIASAEARHATASSAASRAEADVSARRSEAAAVERALDEVQIEPFGCGLIGTRVPNLSR